MRTGFRGGWLEVDGNVVGISLGSDFCSEHEWGINDLKRALGIDGLKPRLSSDKAVYAKPPGLTRRMISKHDRVRLYEHKGAVALICEAPWWFTSFEEAIAKDGLAKAFKDQLPMGLPRQELGCAWSGDDFGIYGTGSSAERIKDLYAAFQSDNVAIWLGGGFVFENSGLILCIADRIPVDKVKALLDADLEVDRLDAASAATGILGRLGKAGRGFFACSPRFMKDDQKKSVHPVIYWLNPAEQDKNNFGWFTVEELDQWIAGHGPIPKTAVNVKA